jgi:predicted Zn finger-like uncharacterized protein
MPLTLNCPKCRKPFRVRDDSVGGRVKCPTCAAVLQVPAHLTSASVESSSSQPSVKPAATTARRHASEGAPARTGKVGHVESFLDDLPEPGPHAGPPSLPTPSTQPMKPRRDEAPERDRERPSERRSRGAETGPLPMPRKHAPRARAKSHDADEILPEQIVEDAEGWRKVRKGLFWIQLAFFLALLPAIGNLAVVAYAANQESKAPEKLTDKGFLGKSLTMWQEIGYGYLFVIPVLVYLIIFMGRLSLLRVPESARTRGTATGLVLLTFITLAAFATYACTVILPNVADTSLPSEAKSISWLVFIYFGLLTEVWYLLCLGQIGVPLRSTRTLRDTALSLLMLVVLIVGVLIANDYYPLLVTSPKIKTEELLNTRMLEAGVYLVVAFVVVFRVTAVTGIIRRAISRWMEEHKETLQAVPD